MRREKVSPIIFFISVSLVSWAGAQNGRGPPSHESGHGWDIRLAVPGEPGNDYPTLGSIPRTHFSCAGKEPGKNYNPLLYKQNVSL